MSSDAGSWGRPAAALASLIAVTGVISYATLSAPERALTEAERHEVVEEREKRLMLQAPPDGGRRFDAAPYDTKNTDGRAGSGGRAVGYRSGGRTDDSPAVVAAAPETRLWGTGFGSWEPSLGLDKAGNIPTGYPNVLYYCAISGGALAGSSTITGCLKSRDGGMVWQITGEPAYPVKTIGNDDFCDGGAGHGVVDGRGNLYVPRGWCGPPTIAISKDEGATWTRRQVSDKLMGPGVHESSVSADPAGNLYYTWVSAGHRPYLSISRDGGNTWSEELDVMPPGVAYVSAFSIANDAGDTGRIAFVFMGTRDAKPGPESLWSAYMVSSADALAADPLFYAAPVNDTRGNTFWKGECGDLRCGNIGDFLGVKIGPDGSAWTALVDSCPGAKDTCITDLPITTPRGEGVVGQLVGGRPLRGTVADQRPGVILPPAQTPTQQGGQGTNRSCPSRRAFTIRLVEPKRGRLREAKVFVNGKRVRVLRGSRLRAKVNLTGLPKGTYTVRVVAVTTTGRKVISTRRYRTCAQRTPTGGR